jgi:LysM repeat protein
MVQVGVSPQVGWSVSGGRPARRDGRAAPPVRLTRRGRVVLLVLLLAVATAVAGLVAAPGQAAERPTAAPTVVVRPGDTLWSIARRYEPRRDPFETIDDIRRLNGIEDFTVHPGQQLTMPSRR